MSSDTPKTDEIARGFTGYGQVQHWLEKLREFERDLAAMTLDRDAAKQSSLEWGQRYNLAAEEREEWKRQAFEMQNERDAAHRDYAAMREACEPIRKAHAATAAFNKGVINRPQGPCQCAICTLSSTAGRNYVRRETVEPAIRLLEKQIHFTQWTDYPELESAQKELA